MIIGVDVQKRYYSVCQIWLRDFESFVIELGDFYPQEFINISLIGQYKVFVSVHHWIDKAINISHWWSNDDAIINIGQNDHPFPMYKYGSISEGLKPRSTRYFFSFSYQLHDPCFSPNNLWLNCRRKLSLELASVWPSTWNPNGRYIHVSSSKSACVISGALL